MSEDDDEDRDDDLTEDDRENLLGCAVVVGAFALGCCLATWMTVLISRW